MQTGSWFSVFVIWSEAYYLEGMESTSGTLQNILECPYALYSTEAGDWLLLGRSVHYKPNERGTSAAPFTNLPMMTTR